MELGELKTSVTVVAEHSFSRDTDGRPNAVEDFVAVLRSAGDDRVSRKAPIALRVSR